MNFTTFQSQLFRVVSGSLRRKQAGLVIGKCSDSDGFTGEIDSVSLTLHSLLT